MLGLSQVGIKTEKVGCGIAEFLKAKVSGETQGRNGLTATPFVARVRVYGSDPTC
jgi:hypothetical protein